MKRALNLSSSNQNLSGGSLAGRNLLGVVLGAGVVIGSVFANSVGIAGDVGPVDVKFMEDNSQIVASVSGVAGDAAAGRKVFSNRKQGNCLACHINSDMGEHSFHGEIGPSLDGVNERYSAAELRAILVDSKRALSEETMMPGFYSLSLGVRVAGKFKDKTILSAQQVEDVLAYLQTLK